MYREKVPLTIRNIHLLAPTIALVFDSDTLCVSNAIPQMLRTPTEKSTTHKLRIQAALFSSYAHQKPIRQIHTDVDRTCLEPVETHRYVAVCFG
jgi:hypothetical protein